MGLNMKSVQAGVQGWGPLKAVRMGTSLARQLRSEWTLPEPGSRSDISFINPVPHPQNVHDNVACHVEILQELKLKHVKEIGHLLLSLQE